MLLQKTLWRLRRQSSTSELREGTRKVNNNFVTGKLELEDVQYMTVLDTARSAAHSLTNPGKSSSPSGHCRVEL